MFLKILSDEKNYLTLQWRPRSHTGFSSSPHSCITNSYLCPFCSTFLPVRWVRISGKWRLYQRSSLILRRRMQNVCLLCTEITKLLHHTPPERFLPAKDHHLQLFLKTVQAFFSSKPEPQVFSLREDFWLESGLCSPVQFSNKSNSLSLWSFPCNVPVLNVTQAPIFSANTRF